MTIGKCRKCRLVNPAGADACRRCGSDLAEARTTVPNRPTSTRVAAKRFSLWPWIGILAAGAAGYYLYSGVEKSYEDVAAAEANRVATERKDAPPGLTRTQYDQRRAGQYGNAVQNSPALATSAEHNNQINKMMK